MQNAEIKTKKTFLNYINVFRGLAILLIIMGHVMQIDNSGGIVHIINCEIICGGTALFIFISGFLFQHLSPKFEYKTYLSKKWTNVIMPYLITAVPGLFFCLYCPVAYKNAFEGLNIFVQIPALLSIGRVHNVPTWFIPMIVLFFISSWILLKLEKKGILYKLLPVFLLVTVLLPRVDIEYENLIGLSYADKYFAYAGYVVTGFIHFFSLYVFGMYCSSKKEIIDKFYNHRFLLWFFMIGTAILNIYVSYKGIYSNYTISKTFLIMLLLGYLKHYDEFILTHEKTNKTLDFIAKYSFGLFFIHWYWLFIYDQIFNVSGVVPLISGREFYVICIVALRFVVITAVSILTLFICSKLIKIFKKDANTRMFLGI